MKNQDDSLNQFRSDVADLNLAMSQLLAERNPDLEVAFACLLTTCAGLAVTTAGLLEHPKSHAVIAEFSRAGTDLLLSLLKQLKTNENN